MNKPNLLFPTPVWTLHLDNYKTINGKCMLLSKMSKQKIKEELIKVLKVGTQTILILNKGDKKFYRFYFSFYSKSYD